jgi:hypothetical protein
VALVGDGGEHGGDQFGIRRQRQIFLGAGADRVDRGARVGADAAGDDRSADAFGLERATSRPISSVTSTSTRSAPRPPRSTAQRLFDVGRMGDFRAAIHRDLGGRADLALQSADDE